MNVRTYLMILSAAVVAGCSSGNTKPDSGTFITDDGRRVMSAPTLAETLKGYEGKTLSQRVAAYNEARPEAQHIECETKVPVGSRMKKTHCYFKQEKLNNKKEIERAKHLLNRPR